MMLSEMIDWKKNKDFSSGQSIFTECLKTFSSQSSSLVFQKWNWRPTFEFYRKSQRPTVNDNPVLQTAASYTSGQRTPITLR